MFICGLFLKSNIEKEEGNKLKLQNIGLVFSKTECRFSWTSQFAVLWGYSFSRVYPILLTNTDLIISKGVVLDHGWA